MSARDVSRALRGIPNGRGYLCRCPVPSHGKGKGDRNPSLSIADGDKGLLVRCFAGCDARDVLAELRHCGLIEALSGDSRPRRFEQPAVPQQTPEPEPDERALELWRNAIPATGTLAERYLRARCITLPSPPSIRFLPHADYMPRISFPAMLAAVQRPDRAVVAVQITFLDPSGDGKAKVATPRRTVGKLGTGAVRLGLAGDALGLAEGVETALSAMQLSSVPVWACIGAGRMHTVTIPSHVHFLEIFADTDQPGRAAMLKTFERHRADLEVRAQLPHERFKDWNDYLAFQARAPMPWELVPC
jgi:putative DNA primase/helicase